MEPMIPYLAGWLHMAIIRDGNKLLSLKDVTPALPDGFVVEFASGVKLKVSVSVEQEPHR